MLGSSSPLAFAFSNSGFVITVIVILIFGWLTSRIPAGKATAVTTREALAYE